MKMTLAALVICSAKYWWN